MRARTWTVTISAPPYKWPRAFDVTAQTKRLAIYKALREWQRHDRRRISERDELRILCRRLG